MIQDGVQYLYHLVPVGSFSQDVSYFPATYQQVSLPAFESRISLSALSAIHTQPVHVQAATLPPYGMHRVKVKCLHACAARKSSYCHVPQDGFTHLTADPDLLMKVKHVAVCLIQLFLH